MGRYGQYEPTNYYGGMYVALPNNLDAVKTLPSLSIKF